MRSASFNLNQHCKLLHIYSWLLVVMHIRNLGCMSLYPESSNRISDGIKIRMDDRKQCDTSNKAPPISFSPPIGTRDFYPEDMIRRNWLFSKFRETATAFGYQEYDAPVLEHSELYTRKAGEEITEQMYSFVDKVDLESSSSIRILYCYAIFNEGTHAVFLKACNTSQNHRRAF